MDSTEKTEKSREMLRKYEYNSRGLCGGCYRPLEKDRLNKMYCRMCTRTSSERTALYRDAHPEYVEKEKMRYRKRVEDRKAEHRCTRCGVVLPENETRLNCDACRERLNAYRRKWSKKK